MNGKYYTREGLQKRFNLTNGDGDVNRFEVNDNDATDSYASFVFQSKLLSEGFAAFSIIANAEDGFEVSQTNKLQANTQFAGALSASGQSIGVDASGYSVSHPSAFCTEIGAIDSAALQSALEDFVTAVYERTTDPGTAGTPWNNGGIWTFSAGRAGQPLGLLLAITRAA